MIKADELDDEDSKLVPQFNEGLELYLAQEWEKSLSAFREAESMEKVFPARSTNPSALYIERCQFLKKNPPGDDWDGIWDAAARIDDEGVSFRSPIDGRTLRLGPIEAVEIQLALDADVADQLLAKIDGVAEKTA